MWKLQTVRNSREIELTVQTAAPGSFLWNQKEGTWQQLVWQETSFCWSRPRRTPSEWQVSARSRSRSCSRRCGFTYGVGHSMLEHFVYISVLKPNPAFCVFKPCSTEIMQTIQRMELCRLNNQAHQYSLMLAIRAISRVQNHPVLPPCAERGRHHQLLSPWDTGKRAGHAGGIGKSAKACGKLELTFLGRDDKRKRRDVLKADQRECRGTAWFWSGLDQYKLPLNDEISVSLHLSFARLDRHLEVWLIMYVNFTLGHWVNYVAALQCLITSVEAKFSHSIIQQARLSPQLSPKAIQRAPGRSLTQCPITIHSLSLLIWYLHTQWGACLLQFLTLLLIIRFTGCNLPFAMLGLSSHHPYWRRHSDCLKATSVRLYL